MSTEVFIDCNGKSFQAVIDETRRTLDEIIATELRAIEWAAVCDGCPPHELEQFMHQNRQPVQAVRDRWLEQQRAWLKDWL